MRQLEPTGRDRALGALLCAALALLGGCESDQERAAARLAEAREALAHGTHGEPVAALLSEAARLDPTLGEARSLLARERLAEERWDEAASEAERALALAPSADDTETLARARVGAGRWEDARAAFVRVLELDPARLALWTDIGRCDEHLEREDEAMTSYRRALEGVPDTIEARLLLAAILVRRASAPPAEAATQAPFVDAHAAERVEARALLSAARERLAEGDDRRASVEGYLAELATLDAAVARERERRAAQADLAVARELAAQQSILAALGAMGSGGLGDVLRGGDMWGGSGLDTGLGASDLGMDSFGEAGLGGMGTSGAGLGGGGGGAIGGLGTRGTGGGGELGGLGRGGGRGAEPVRVTVSASANGGLDGEAAARVARAHTAALRACHARGALADPTLAGTVVVAVTVSAAGIASGASTSGSIDDASVRECAAAAVTRMAFPAASGESRVTITARFEM